MRLRSGGMTTSAARRWAAPAVAVAAVATLTCTTSAAVAAPLGAPERRPPPAEPGSPTWRWGGRPAGEPHLTHPPAGRHAHRDHPRHRRPGPRGRSRRWSRPRRTTPTPMRRRRPWPTRPRLSGRPTAWPRRATRHGSRPWRSPVRSTSPAAPWATGSGWAPTRPRRRPTRPRQAGRRRPPGQQRLHRLGRAGGGARTLAARGRHHRPAPVPRPARRVVRAGPARPGDHSALSRAAGATSAVNGGFFVLDPKSGAPGDPAGVGVYDGRCSSEPTAGRPALVLRSDARGTSVPRLSGRARSSSGGGTTALDGINRVPGLIRNCGGDPTDLPTALPAARHHVHRRQRARRVHPAVRRADAGRPGARGRPRRALRRPVQRTDPGHRPVGGADVDPGDRGAGPGAGPAPVGDRVGVRTRLVDDHGRTVRPGPDTSVVNGGPQLVRDGRWDVTLRQDGMVQTANPGFLYGWAVKRNPRTFAGVDAQGAPCWSPRTGAAPLTWA